MVSGEIITLLVSGIQSLHHVHTITVYYMQYDSAYDYICMHVSGDYIYTRICITACVQSAAATVCGSMQELCSTVARWRRATHLTLKSTRWRPCLSCDYNILIQSSCDFWPFELWATFEPWWNNVLKWRRRHTSSFYIFSTSPAVHQSCLVIVYCCLWPLKFAVIWQGINRSV